VDDAQRAAAIATNAAVAAGASGAHRGFHAAGTVAIDGALFSVRSMRLSSATLHLAFEGAASSVRRDAGDALLQYYNPKGDLIVQDIRPVAYSWNAGEYVSGQVMMTVDYADREDAPPVLGTSAADIMATYSRIWPEKRETWVEPVIPAGTRMDTPEQLPLNVRKMLDLLEGWYASVTVAQGHLMDATGEMATRAVWERRPDEHDPTKFRRKKVGTTLKEPVTTACVRGATADCVVTATWILSGSAVEWVHGQSWTRADGGRVHDTQLTLREVIEAHGAGATTLF
jgi:hypothetical protein